MTDSPPKTTPPKKKRSRSFCAGCLLFPLIIIAILAALYFIGPPLLRWLGIFGPPAEQVYAAAPDLVASAEINEIFDEQSIPGVRVYVLPIDGRSTQGAFIILDASRGYLGLNPTQGKDDTFLRVIQNIHQRNQAENLRLEHVTVEYRDEFGEKVVGFTVPQDLVEDYATERITRDDFFREIDIDILQVIDYYNLRELLEEINNEE